MDDRALVAALVSGDPRGLEGAYRTYADRLYTYCRGMLHDPDAAADAVHDTFLLAGRRAGQLRDPERLRSWLYAIARNECLRQLRGRARHVALEEAGQVSAPPTEPGGGLHADEVQELVRAAAAGLNPGDREVIELALRHELPAAEISAALGVSLAHAHARMSRARNQLERALSALLVARHARRECPRLDELLAGWDGHLTALMRKRVSRHIESCGDCAERRRRLVSPAALFSAYTGLPMLAVPAQLWPRLQHTSADPAAVQAVEQRATRWDPATGFPRPRHWHPQRTAVAAVAAAAAAALLVVAGGILAPILVDASPPAAPPVAAVTGPPAAGLSPSPAAPAAPTGSPTAGVPTPPATVDPPGGPGGPGGSIVPPPGATTAPTVSASPTAAEPLVVRAAGRFECRRLLYRLVVEAHANLDLAEGQLIVESGTAPPQTYDLSIDGTRGAVTTGSAARSSLTWHVVVTATDGQEVASTPVTVPEPCA